MIPRNSVPGSIYLCCFYLYCIHVLLVVVYGKSMVVMSQPIVPRGYLIFLFTMRLSVLYARLVMLQQ